MQRGDLSTEEFRLFHGVTPETLALFGDALGTSGEQRELLDKYLQMTKANHSALRRMIRRKGTAGYSEDVQRTLAAMLTSNARAGAAALHAGMMDEATQAIDERGETGRGRLKDYAVRFVEYVRNPGRESQRIRGLLFINFIGGSVASAIVNLTQTATQTYPYIASKSSPAAATRIVTAAMRDAMRAPDPQSDLARAIHHAEEEGVISPQALHELQGQALNKLGGVESVMRAMGVGTQAAARVEGAMRKALFGWGGFFSLAEQYNRRVAFIAGYRLAIENGEADPMASAASTVNETQNVYNRGNRPEWARGPVGAVVMTYTQFKLNYIEFLSRLPPHYAGLALLALALMSGLEGLPFSDDLDDLLDTLAQRLLGRAWSTKLERTRLLTALFNRETAEFLLHGASALPGFPADLAGRLSLGNMIPGTGAFLMANQGKASEVLEALGPAGGVVRDALRGEVAPIAARNLAKGIEAAQTGEFRNAKGEKMADATLGQAALKAIGFNPQHLARASRDRALVQRVIDQTRAVESEIVRAVATGIVDRKPDRVNAAVERLAQWNRKNPEFPIDVNEAQIAAAVKRLRSEREDRFIMSVPRELREAARGATRAP